MKFNKYCISLVVCVVFLIPTESAVIDEINHVNLLKAAIPNLDVLVASLSKVEPVGPNLVESLGLLHVAAAILADIKVDNKREVSSALSKVDFLKSQQFILDSIQNFHNDALTDSARVILELPNFIESQEFLQDLPEKLERFRKSYADNMGLILNPKITGFEKKSIIKTLFKYSSPFREDLRTFIDTYIKQSTITPLSEPVKLIFERILEKDRLLAKENDDCYTDSVVSKVFKVYLYIAKILTDSYAMVISAEVIQLQLEIQDGRLAEANSTKAISEEILDEYKNNMKDLFDKTKWALDNASRDIKNCGKFTKLEQGVDYERLSFVKILPNPMYMPAEECIEHQAALNLSDYDLGKCNECPTFPAGSHFSIFYNSSRPESPYQYMKVELPNYAYYGTYGHEESLLSQSRTNAQCKTVFYKAFKEEAAAFSTELVRTKIGYVITGIRFRVRKNVVYIDIQQGKYLDPISVDPTTVFWSKTPESENVVYLNSSVNKIELGDFELENGFLQEINIYYSSTNNIISNDIRSIIVDSDDDILGPYEPMLRFNEVRIKEGDDPAILGTTVKNFVSKAPSPQQPHFITFQPSDFKKDFGRSTVPFIDTREIVTDPPAPCGGFGIYHQAGEGSGGFLSLKLIAPKLSQLVDYKQIEKFTNSSTNVELEDYDMFKIL